MLKHIALTINDSEEIERFYIEILQFAIKNKFTVNEKITRQVFNLNGCADVYLMVYEDIVFEVFISSKRERKVFSHIALAYPDAEIIYNKAIQSGYKGLVRSNSDNCTFFIRDKSANMFEIKELSR